MVDSVTIDDLSPKEGQMLTATVVGNGSNPVTYQWQVGDGQGGWTNVGADQATYTATEADENHAIRVVASFTDDTGQPASVTDQTDTVNDNSSLTVSISGIAQEGQTLTAVPVIGDADDATATVHYQWQVGDGQGGWTNVGADQATYTVAEADENHAIRVAATFTDDTGQDLTAATSTDLVIDNSSLIVSISGTAKEGQTLTAVPVIGDADDANAIVHYLWQVADGQGGWRDVGLDQPTYVVTEADENQAVRVIASFMDDTSQHVSATSSPTAAVVDDTTLTVTIAGTAVENAILQASTNLASDSDDSMIAVRYQWQHSSDGGHIWTDIFGASSATYELAQGDVGDIVRVHATVIDDTQQTIVAESAASASVTAPNLVPNSNFLASGLAGDFNGDHLNDWLQIDGTNGDVWLSTGTSFSALANWATGVESSTKIADLNGDGMSDLIQFDLGTNHSGSMQAALSNGHGFDAFSLWTTGATASDQLADVNGDGLADLVQYYNGREYAASSTGSSFGTWSLWANGATASDKLVDVNGDGKADEVQYYNGTTEVALSTGSKFGTFSTWQTGDLSSDKLIDVNGDGRADLVQLYHGQDYVSLSNGSKGFGAWSPWASSGTSNDRISDLTGDGKADVVQIDTAGNVVVGVNNGGGFDNQVVWTTGATQNDKLVDLNGDGKADLLQTVHEQNGTTVAEVALSNGHGFDPWHVWA